MAEEPEKKPEEAKEGEAKPEEAKPAEAPKPEGEAKPEEKKDVENKVKLDIIKKILDDKPAESKEGVTVVDIPEGEVKEGEARPEGESPPAPENAEGESQKFSKENIKKIAIGAGIVLVILILVFFVTKLPSGPTGAVVEEAEEEVEETEGVNEEGLNPKELFNKLFNANPAEEVEEEELEEEEPEPEEKEEEGEQEETAEDFDLGSIKDKVLSGLLGIIGDKVSGEEESE